jgi:fatty acid desaturase
MLSDINQWFLGLGAEYGVNPYIFGAIYVGAIPFFLLSIGWLVKNARAGKSTLLPTMSAGFFFVSAYIYLAIAGRNIPVWVWVFLAALIAYGAWSSIRDTRRKIAEAKAEDVAG